METTSRNSEVIHAGIYYPPNSLKSKLCIAGKNKIYDAWAKGNFQIKTYFPSITLDSLHPSYSGVRPKIYSLEENMKKFADFEIKQEPGYPGFVNLLGMESPGLTASWAIGEYVKDLYHK